MNNKQKQIKRLPKKAERHRIFGSTSPGKRTKPTVKDAMVDLQNKQDDYFFKLDQVGISNVKHPVKIYGEKEPQLQTSIATFGFYSSIDKGSKGTNMSRFTEQLAEAYRHDQLDLKLKTLKAFTKALANRLKTEDATLEVTVPYFYQQPAPDSHLSGLNHVDLVTKVTYRAPDTYTVEVGLTATITTLCPCSKEISEYSAHNQRGIVQVEVELHSDFDESIEDWKHFILEAAESNASARIHPILKRPDEKVVTEHAYENPRFVEDMVRLVSADIYEWEAAAAFKVSCRNEESIHLHDAFASITFDKRVDER
ncbi:GTP cyclohydrolase I [Streptohalobacillus salinus]|uniref:GTP cyclohydrolase FolE2 n=1 Tax=Streptohalobacillus salinus TaxID=621096 RepID=A0A2V3WT26_9BACI|nr:GTP cyclohydrolase FolE2 [Streptohalobacillus salinus]PXW91859.1 GTP cyclohydrolase I [Streptohalobacillus salinus]